MSDIERTEYSENKEVYIKFLRCFTGKEDFDFDFVLREEIEPSFMDYQLTKKPG